MASSARIDELRKKFEENPRRYFAPLANEYRKAGDIDQAISICKEYLPQQPGHMSGHIVYGQALYEARQYEEARTVFETALALDPENLIALRHLGDIALIVGDIDGARGWYGRVLEADPRNEEIQAQLKSLESVRPAAAPTPMSTPVVESPPETAAVNQSVSSLTPVQLPTLELTPPPAAEPEAATPTPASSAPTLVAPAMPMPTIERTVEIPATPPSAPVQSLSTTPTAEITLDQVPDPAIPDLGKAAEAPAADLPVEKAAGFEPTSAGSTEPPPLMQTDGLETTTSPAATSPAAEAAAPPIDSFTLDGLETTAMSPTPAGEAALAGDATPPPSGEPPPPPATEPPLAAAETPPAALPEFEVALPPTAETLPPAATEPAASADAELTFLDVGEASPSAAVSAPAAPAEPPMAESKPFVTETMAELYEQQGHRDEALRVYRALLGQRPNDAHIQQRIEQLEGKRGPTIRELLARAAARRPAPKSPPPSEPVVPSAGTSATAAPPPAAPPPAPVETASPAVVPEPAAAPAREPEPVPAPAAAARAAQTGNRQDLLGQLFGSPSVASPDETAAVTLSAAFSNNARANGSGSPSQPLSGTPAHPASKDLSLDAVFGTQSPVPPPASSFSFDQFFSERATAEHPTPGGRGAAEGQETKDDVAKFTQWLEGLKQR